MLDEEVAKEEIDSLSFWVHHCGSFCFWDYAKYTQLIFGGGDESIELINIISLYSDLVEEVQIDILRLRFTAEFNLLIFYPTHLKLSYNYNLQIHFISVVQILKPSPSKHFSCSLRIANIEYTHIIAQIIIGFLELKSAKE